ncbi:MAG: hypothetical protein JRN15_09260 [Nitrososphaerota archaeon]|nr:hypothetical protein [Nitrososphaerota archaeon]
MALDDPLVLLAIPLLIVLIAYQFYSMKGRKHSDLQSLGLAVVTLGVIVLMFFDFLTAFVFFSAGILIFMTGELVSRITS